jgi:hypothetical protein
MAKEIRGLYLPNALEITTHQTRTTLLEELPPLEVLGNYVALHDGTGFMGVARVACVLGFWDASCANGFTVVLTGVIALGTPVEAAQPEPWAHLTEHTLMGIRLEYKRALQKQI